MSVRGIFEVECSFAAFSSSRAPNSDYDCRESPFRVASSRPLAGYRMSSQLGRLLHTLLYMYWAHDLEVSINRPCDC